MAPATERVFQCPHCGNITPHVVLGEQWTDIYEAELPGEVYRILQFAECGTCKGATLFESVGDEEDPVQVVWPGLDLPPGVPTAVCSIYREAQHQRPRDAHAFAMHIRRAMEAICSDKHCGTTSDALGNRLKGLKSTLPLALQDMPEVLKDICNKGPHFDAQLTTSDLRLIEMFFNALVEYVYRAPYKLELYTKLLSRAPRKAKRGTSVT